MGIHDRSYMQGGGGRGGSVGGFGARQSGVMSFTVILIIINVGVFLLDGMLGAQMAVPVQTSPAVVLADRLDDGADPKVVKPAWGSQRAGSVVTEPVVDARSGARIGEVRFEFMTPMAALGHFSTATGFMKFEIWRFLSFQFLHANFMHLFFNMLGLYFFGPVVEQWLGSRKRFAAFYLACGMMGGAAYLLLNLLGNMVGDVPGLLPSSVYVPLVGASAGVFGVLMASAKLAGNARMLVMFVIPMKVSTGAYLLTGMAGFNLLFGGTNAGGDAAHLGGAIAGFVLIRRPHWLNDFFDIVGRKGDSKQRSGRDRGVREQKTLKDKQKEQAEVNRLLDKVKANGTGSLTEKEKAFLEKVSREG